ncbi:MAG: phosphocholine cytidylyltransferase family protein [Candidatus Omnitrophica bacterium]|nr:phosphocholine cytidylyltransferase family protein [Candidatus Omnitrophota bacterium]
MRAILLAAGRGRRLGPLATQGPKCMMEAAGEPLLKRTLEGLVNCGVREIVIVIGYQKEKILALLDSEQKLLAGTKVIPVENPDFTKGNIISLWSSASYFDSDLLIMDADVYFEFPLLKRLLDSPLKDCFLLDAGFKNTGEEVVLMTRQGRVLDLAKVTSLPAGYDLLGESVGFLKLSQEPASLLKEILQEMVTDGFIQSEYEQAYQRLLQKIPVGYEAVGNLFWMEVDFPEDLAKLHARLKSHAAKS